MLAGLLSEDPSSMGEAADQEELDMEESMALINAAFDNQDLEESMSAIRQAELELWQRSSPEPGQGGGLWQTRDVELELGLADSIDFLSAALTAEMEKYAEPGANDSGDTAKARKQRKADKRQGGEETKDKNKKTKKSDTERNSSSLAGKGRSHSRDSRSTPAPAAPPPAVKRVSIRHADDGPDSSNGGVYRSCVIGSALFAALKEMTETLPGCFRGSRKEQEEARKAILAHFDRCMEEQITHVTGGGSGGNGDGGHSSVPTGASASYSSKNGPAKNIASSSSTSSSSTISSSSSSSSTAVAHHTGQTPKRGSPASAKLPSLRATVAAYGCHGGLWNIQCEDAVFSTGPRSRTLTIPHLELWFKARDRKRARRPGESAAGNDMAPIDLTSAAAAAGAAAGAGAGARPVKKAKRST
jgi:hypothetical protein